MKLSDHYFLKTLPVTDFHKKKLVQPVIGLSVKL